VDKRVTTSTFEKRLIAERYATALHELAKKSDAVGAVESDLNVIGELLQTSPDLSKLIYTTLYAREDQVAAVKSISQKAGFQNSTENTLAVLAQNRRLGLVPEMIEIFKKQRNHAQGVVIANVEVATEMSAEQQTQLQTALKQISGGKDIRLDISVNKSLLGGMIVTLGSKMIDTSVRTKLNNLENTLKETN
jgi:F-type H+-transporting ATPase subunit delta